MLSTHSVSRMVHEFQLRYTLGQHIYVQGLTLRLPQFLAKTAAYFVTASNFYTVFYLYKLGLQQFE